MIEGNLTGEAHPYFGQNGQAAAPGDGAPMVAFGPEPHQVISTEVASMVLSLWRERAPAVFGAYLAEVLTGARPRGARG